MLPETSDLLDMVSDAWEQAYEHALTVEQLLYEFDSSGVSSSEIIDRINEATMQYHNAMGRYKVVSGQIRVALSDTLN